MHTLTPEQLDAIAASPDGVLRLSDGENQAFVLLKAEVFDRMKTLLFDDAKPQDMYPAVDRAFAEGWNHPGMEDYDRYEELKK